MENFVKKWLKKGYWYKKVENFVKIVVKKLKML